MSGTRVVLRRWCTYHHGTRQGLQGARQYTNSNGAWRSWEPKQYATVCGGWAYSQEVLN